MGRLVGRELEHEGELLDLEGVRARGEAVLLSAFLVERRLAVARAQHMVNDLTRLLRDPSICALQTLAVRSLMMLDREKPLANPFNRRIQQ